MHDDPKRRRLAWLTSEQVELHRLIADCDPDDVTRIGFEARLEKVTVQLATELRDAAVIDDHGKL
ncbi:MAG: hypothetical protein J0L92_24670 [Deltaproteobacteria bacterium]|nr:hypothetical protein [Deltaproteobacteria bacterium]